MKYLHLPLGWEICEARSRWKTLYKDSIQYIKYLHSKINLSQYSDETFWATVSKCHWVIRLYFFVSSSVQGFTNKSLKNFWFGKSIISEILTVDRKPSRSSSYPLTANRAFANPDTLQKTAHLSDVRKTGNRHYPTYLMRPRWPTTTTKRAKWDMAWVRNLRPWIFYPGTRGKGPKFDRKEANVAGAKLYWGGLQGKHANSTITLFAYDTARSNSGRGCLISGNPCSEKGKVEECAYVGQRELGRS